MDEIYENNILFILFNHNFAFNLNFKKFTVLKNFKTHEFNAVTEITGKISLMEFYKIKRNLFQLNKNVL